MLLEGVSPELPTAVLTLVGILELGVLSLDLQVDVLGEISLPDYFIIHIFNIAASVHGVGHFLSQFGLLFLLFAVQLGLFLAEELLLFFELGRELVCEPSGRFFLLLLGE